MDLSAGWEVLIILVLILLNGFFAGAEIAVLTARRGRLQQKADAGDRSAKLALGLAAEPNRFLATVQVGITFIGTFAAAFGGASLVESLAGVLEQIDVPAITRNRHGIALALVSLGIAFVSLVLGELVPKRIALANAEGLARLVARPMALVAWVARPVVWLLAVCSNAVLMLMGSRDLPERSVSLEDIQHLVQTGTAEGLIEPAEQRMVIGALGLGERTVREIQTPRIDIEAIDIETPPDQVLQIVVDAGYTRLPVYEGDLDNVVGFLFIKDVLRRQQRGEPLDLREMMRPPLFVPETQTIDRLLEAFRTHGTQVAIVLDEYGGTEGMVTVEDAMEELVGEIHDELHREQEQLIVQRDDQSWLIDGTVTVRDLLEHLKGTVPPAEPPRGISTVSGLVLSELGRLPKIGDAVEWNRLRVEVVDMDGRRIDRVLVQPLPPPEESDEDE